MPPPDDLAAYGIDPVTGAYNPPDEAVGPQADYLSVYGIDPVSGLDLTRSQKDVGPFEPSGWRQAGRVLEGLGAKAVQSFPKMAENLYDAAGAIPVIGSTIQSAIEPFARGAYDPETQKEIQQGNIGWKSDVGQQVVGAAAPIAALAAAGPAAAPLVGTSAFGAQRQQALQEGASETQANLAGVFAGTLSTLTANVGGELIGPVKQTLLDGAKSALTQYGRFGALTYLQSMAQKALNQGLYQPDGNVSPQEILPKWNAEALQEAGQSVAGVALAGAAGAVGNRLGGGEPPQVTGQAASPEAVAKSEAEAPIPPPEVQAATPPATPQAEAQPAPMPDTASPGNLGPVEGITEGMQGQVAGAPEAAAPSPEPTEVVAPAPVQSPQTPEPATTTEAPASPQVERRAIPRPEGPLTVDVETNQATRRVSGIVRDKSGQRVYETPLYEDPADAKSAATDWAQSQGQWPAEKAPIEDTLAEYGIDPVTGAYAPPEEKPDTFEERAQRPVTPSGIAPKDPVELMEASRRLGALARSKSTLPDDVLGRYVRSLEEDRQQIREPRIETANVADSLNVAHEIGHHLDALLFHPDNALERSQQSLADRIDYAGDKRDLVKELTPVSEMMRGPVDTPYRKRASELIADYASLYIHDPAKASEMAPRFTAGFEDALAKDPETRDTIQQLQAGKVEPVGPAKRTTGETTTPVEPPGGMLPPEKIVGLGDEGRLASQGIVTKTGRQQEAEKQSARITSEKWQNIVPNQDQRNDIGAFVEGIGNISKKGDTAADVRARMTPEMKMVAKDYRFKIEQVRQKVNEYLKGITDGEYLKFLEDYLPHIYANARAKIQSTSGSKLMRSSPFSKERRLPTLKEAADMGLIPLSQDPAKLYRQYSDINWRVATTKKAISEIGNLRTLDGEPAYLPPEAPTPPGYIRHPSGSYHPEVWPAMRQILERPISSGIGKAYDAVNHLTRSAAFFGTGFHHFTIAQASLGMRALTGDLSDIGSVRARGKALLEDEATMRDAAKSGLMTRHDDADGFSSGAQKILEQVAARTRNVPVVGKVAEGLRRYQAWQSEELWRNEHDADKIYFWEKLVGKELSRSPGVSSDEVKQRVSSLLNDSFGSQEWMTKFWLSPQARLAMDRFWLAPDWTLSTLRSVPGLSDLATAVRGKAFKTAGKETSTGQYEGTKTNLMKAGFWGGELAAIAMGHIALQYSIYQAFGDKDKGDHEFPWENEYGNRLAIDITPLVRQLPWAVHPIDYLRGKTAGDTRREYVNLAKRPLELLRWLSNPMEQIASKAARPLAEIAKQVTSTEGGGKYPAPWARDQQASFPETIPQRALSAGEIFLPFSLQGNQFALSAPMRHGMTPNKAKDAYKSVYELAADPGKFTEAKAFLRGVPPPEGTLKDMVKQITDAAKANGFDTEKMREKALQEVRTPYYSAYFKAKKEGDQDAMDRNLEILKRIGSTNKGLAEAGRLRQNP